MDIRTKLIVAGTTLGIVLVGFGLVFLPIFAATSNQVAVVDEMNLEDVEASLAKIIPTLEMPQQATEPEVVETQEVPEDIQVQEPVYEEDYSYDYDEYYYEPEYVEEEYAEPEYVEPAVEPSSDSSGYSPDEFRSAGVVYGDDGTRYTWYSQRVLPGNGLHDLNNNGRHVNDQGYVCDGDGYIAVASGDYPQGTVVDTPFGQGKVYDSGCDSGTIDVYTDF